MVEGRGRGKEGGRAKMQEWRGGNGVKEGGSEEEKEGRRFREKGRVVER